MSNLDQYRKLHAEGWFPGHSTAKNADIIGELIRKHGSSKILDFGCGKGKQYTEQKLHERWGIEMPALYDPAVPGIDRMPNGFHPFDAVICCDVLEHLEGEELKGAIFNASIRARQFVFFSIATYPAKKTLPDGRNAHLTIQNADWWEGAVRASVFPHAPLAVHLRFDHKDRYEDRELVVARSP